MKNNNLTNQKHWDDSYKDLTFFKPSFSDPISRVIKKHIASGDSIKKVFEVGCFPGRYLSIFGDKKYVLNGIDLTPRVLTDMPEWLNNKGYKNGNFYCDDFFKVSFDNTYDIVCSFGFIEHFVNYKDVLLRHLSIVSSDGIIIVSTPNFKGFLQRVLHKLLDKSNLDRHYLPSMDPLDWKKILTNNGCEIIFCGYIGGFDFWAESDSKNTFKKILIKILNLSGKVLRFLPFNGKIFSPYAIIVAKKNK